MNKYANRVKKIEVARRGKYDPNWHIVDECGHLLIGDVVEQNPDMRLVQPCDTDPYTFARIQVYIAYTDFNEKLLNRYWAQSCKPKPPRLPNETDDEWVLRYAKFDPEEDADEQRREKQAIENARARVAKNPQANKNTSRQSDPWERDFK